jgi:hypothetical protein
MLGKLNPKILGDLHHYSWGLNFQVRPRFLGGAIALFAQSVQ